MPKLHIYKNEKETCSAFVEWMADLAKETLNKQDRFTIALSAGDTLKTVIKILANEYITKIDWSRVHIFVVGEEFVSYSKEKNGNRSNLESIRDQLPIAKDQFHQIRTDIAPEEAAKQYEKLLLTFFDTNHKSFDLIILGMGEHDNHLSLLPLAEESHHGLGWVVPVFDEKEDVFKVTLTLAAINASGLKAFLVTGKKKEDLVQQVLKGKYEPEKYPAQLIVTAGQTVHWFLDEGAAGKLIKPIS